MSPALLAMTLSMYGEDDSTVSNVDDFERLVALRELALLRIAGVRVCIIYLTKPIPHKSNSNYTKFLNSPSKPGASDSVDDYYDFHLLLPRGLFKCDRGSSSPLTLVDPGTALVLVNAPLAAGPDVTFLRITSPTLYDKFTALLSMSGWNLFGWDCCRLKIVRFMTILTYVRGEVAIQDGSK